MAQTINNLRAMQETQVQSLGREDPLEKKMATHSSILAWETPQTEEPVRLQSMGFPRLEYWSGLPFSSPGDLPYPGIKTGSLALQADSLPSEPPEKPLVIELSSRLLDIPGSNVPVPQGSVIIYMFLRKQMLQVTWPWSRPQKLVL